MTVCVLLFLICFNLISLSVSQDLSVSMAKCHNAKSSCSLYSAQHQRLVDMEKEMQEVLQKLSMLTAQKGKETSSTSTPIAFTALKQRPEHVIASTIKFENVTLNEGNGYNAYSGEFTASSNGIYIFSWTIVTEETFVIGTELTINGGRVAYSWTDARKENGGVEDSGSNTISARLKSGDVVAIRTMSRWDSFVGGLGWSSFTGWKVGD